MGLIDWLLGRLIADDAVSTTRSTARRSKNVGGVAVLEPAMSDSHRGGIDAAQTEPNWWAPEGVDQLEPVGPSRPNMTTEARAIENTLVSHFDGHDLSMPPLPSVTERVLRRLRDGKSSLAEVAKDIADDQVIAAEVIRMSNSALYRGLNKTTSLQAAVTRLGVKAIRTTMLNQSMRAAMFSKKGADNDLSALIWYQSLAGSCVLRGLGKLLNVDEDEAALIGLMHDIGSVIVLRFVEEHEKASHALLDVDNFDYLCSESHQEFGELVAEAWNLPDAIKSLAGNHHLYPADDDPLRRERLMVILSDMICAMLGYAPPASYQLMETPVVADLGLNAVPAFRTFLENLPAEVESVLLSFGAVPGSPVIDDPDEAPHGVLPGWLHQIRRARSA